MKDIKICINSVQLTGDAVSRQNYEIFGKYSFSPQNAVIRYIEPEETGLGRVSTHISISQSAAVIRRYGDIKCEMKMKQGERVEFSYKTPQGTIDMAACLKFFGKNLGENGGRAVLRYDMYFDNEKISENELNITIREI